MSTDAASIFSAIAAGASAFAAGVAAIAAWKALSLNRAAQERAHAADCDRLRREVEETARAIVAESKRAEELCSSWKNLRDTLAAKGGAHGGSAHAEAVANITSTIAGLVETRKEAERVIASSPSTAEGLELRDIGDPLPRLRARRVEVQGIIDQCLRDIETLLELTRKPGV